MVKFVIKEPPFYVEIKKEIGLSQIVSTLQGIMQSGKMCYEFIWLVV